VQKRVQKHTLGRLARTIIYILFIGGVFRDLKVVVSFTIVFFPRAMMDGITGSIGSIVSVIFLAIISILVVTFLVERRFNLDIILIALVVACAMVASSICTTCFDGRVFLPFNILFFVIEQITWRIARSFVVVAVVRVGIKPRLL